MSVSDQRNKLRAILSGQRCVSMATVFDPLSSRMADILDFEAGLMGGSLASYAVLGAPDLILITLSELAEQVYRCTHASNVPLVVDGDHGYGNALNVMRTVQEIDRAGAGALMIEDTLLPRAFGSSQAPQLVSLDEGVGKMKAAIKARADSDLVIMGRTSAHAITGIEDAVARCVAYEAAGVDALFFPALRTRDELDRISAAVKVPLVTGSPADSMCDDGYLASRRVRLWSTGHQTLSVAINALFEAMKTVREGTPSSKLQGTASKELINKLTASSDYSTWTDAYLKG